MIEAVTPLQAESACRIPLIAPAAQWVRAAAGTRNPTWLSQTRALSWMPGVSDRRVHQICKVMEQARRAGVPAPRLVSAWTEPEGAWLLAERVPGDPAQELSLRQCAQVLARLHTVSIEHTPCAEIGDWGSDSALGALPDDPVFGHFDLFADNVLVQGKRVTGLVDWEFAGRGPRVLDIAIAALGHSRARPVLARQHLFALAERYEIEAECYLDRAALVAAYLYAVDLFVARRLALGSNRPVQDLQACALHVQREP